MSNSIKINRMSILCFFVALYPVIPSYFDVGGINFNNIILVGCLFMMILLGYGRIGKVPHLNCIFFLLIYVVYLIINNFINQEYMEIFWEIVLFLGMGTMFICTVNTKDKFLRSIDSMIYASGVVCIFGIIESITHFNVFEWLNTSNATIYYNAERFGLTRIVAFGYQTITYCVYIMFMAAFALYRLSVMERSKKRTKILVIYFLMWVNALLTLSRSAILAMLFCQALLAIKCGFVKFVKRVFLIMVIALVVGSIYSSITGGINFATAIVQMLIALVDESTSADIASSFGNDNLDGVGQRVILYTWVANSMDGHWLLGWGRSQLFEYAYTYNNAWNTQLTKASIEVQYLYTLYHYGIIGLVTEIIAYVAIIVTSLKKNRLNKCEWEGKLSFNFVFLSIMISYILVMFAVNRSAEMRAFYVMVFLFLAYNANYHTMNLNN